MSANEISGQIIDAPLTSIYLKLGNYSLGLLINFNVVRLKDGIKRLVNGIDE